MDEEKFIDGKWYKGEINDFYFKYLQLESLENYNRIHYSERIFKAREKGNHLGWKGFEKINSYISNTQMENFALNNPVSLSEIQEFLPKGHPDEIVVSEEKENYSYITNILKKLNIE